MREKETDRSGGGNNEGRKKLDGVAVPWKRQFIGRKGRNCVE